MNNLLKKLLVITYLNILSMKELLFISIKVELQNRINFINSLIKQNNKQEAIKQLENLKKETNLPELHKAIGDCIKDNNWDNYKTFLNYYK